MIYNIMKPARDSDADFDRVHSKAKDEQFAVLTEARDRILQAYRHYDLVEGNPKTVTPLELSNLAKETLKSQFAYTQRRRLLAALRDEAMRATVRGRCPFCGLGKALALDHYLPKERYPEFSIFCLNLVPICTRCNGKKGDLIGTDDGSRFFHAFYDYLPEDIPLLDSQIVFNEHGLFADFQVNKLLPSHHYKVAKYHFTKLELADYYSEQASIELIEQVKAISRLYGKDRADEVVKFADDQARWLRETFGFHYWQAALYDAIKSSDQFCDGGFRVLDKSGTQSRTLH